MSMNRAGRRGGMVAVFAALLGLALVLSGGAASANPSHANSRALAPAHLGVTSPALRSYQTNLNFANPFNTHIFTIRIGSGGSTFTADTLDGGQPGDHWGVFVMRYGGTPLGSSNPTDATCGTGSTNAFSGDASLYGSYLSGGFVQVVVTHCSGISSFPAGLTVRFRSNATMRVTQRT